MSPTLLVHRGVAAASFPTVEGTTVGGDTARVNPCPVTLPTGIASGERLIIVIRVASSSATLATPSGWTLVASGGDGFAYVFRRTADGTEGGTTVNFTVGVVTDVRSAWNAYHISGATDIEAAITDATLDQGALTPTWGSAKTRWIAIGTARRTDNTLTAPSGYANTIVGITNPSVADTLECRVSTAHRESEATSEDPGAWTSSGTVNRPVSGIIAVRPA